MIAAFVAGLLTVWVPYLVFLRAERTRTKADIEFERSRTQELLQLLEARSAPAEFAAYVHEAPETPSPTWLFDQTGLIGVTVDDD